MQIKSKIKILQRNYVYHRSNFIVQVRREKQRKYAFRIILSYLVLAEDAIKAAIHDYNTKKIKQQKQN